MSIPKLTTEDIYDIMALSNIDFSDPSHDKIFNAILLAWKKGVKDCRNVMVDVLPHETANIKIVMNDLRSIANRIENAKVQLTGVDIQHIDGQFVFSVRYKDTDFPDIDKEDPNIPKPN